MDAAAHYCPSCQAWTATDECVCGCQTGDALRPGLSLVVVRRTGMAANGWSRTERYEGVLRRVLHECPRGVWSLEVQTEVCELRVSTLSVRPASAEAQRQDAVRAALAFCARLSDWADIKRWLDRGVA